MSEPRLLIDLGNTRVKWVWARGAEIDEGSAGRGGIDALETALEGRGVLRPAAVLLSSVAGRDATQRVTDLCRERWGVDASLLQSRAVQGGVRNGYTEPARLGVDRWLAIVGAVSRYGMPVVVWDLGTATTLDGVDDAGRHQGGWILPGPATMLLGLAEKTKLPVPGDLVDGSPAEPGRSTAECIRRGVLAAQIGALSLFTKRISASGGGAPRLVVSGGAASAVLSQYHIDHSYDPLLVFRGMLVD